MSPLAIAIMVVMLGGVWGTFVYLLVRVARQEKQGSEEFQN